MNQYKIRHAWYPNAWKVYPICNKAIDEFRESERGDPQMGYYLWFLWAEDELSRPIGVIAFAFDSIEKDVWIELAYTEPEHRRRGVYRARSRGLLRGPQSGAFGSSRAASMSRTTRCSVLPPQVDVNWSRWPENPT